MSLKIKILGCGNSSGVPAIGNYWGVCDPSEPRNIRMRSSLSVQSNETTIIVDTGPDISRQTTLFDITSIDGVFYTHQHSDHTNGISDLRMMYFRNGCHTIPCYGSAEALDEILQRFDYMFIVGDHTKLYPPVLTVNSFETNQYNEVQSFKDISYIPFLMDHGTCAAVGYRFGDLSYCVDIRSMDDKALECIKGSKIWIVDGSGYNSKDHPVHASLETLYRYNEYLEVQEVYITSLSPSMDYKTLLKELPEGYYPAYDGQTFKSEC